MSHDDTRRRVLQAAGPVFADHGYQAATVREICRKAGVNLASVNYHFGDKQRLYVETVKRAHQSRAEQVPLPDWPPGTSAQQRLRDFIRTLTTRMLGGKVAPWETRLMLREVLQPTEACEGLVEEYFRPHFEMLLAILDELLPAETPPYKRQQIAFSIVGQCLYYRVANDVVRLLVSEDELERHYAPDQLAEHITQVSLAAFGLTAPLSASWETASQHVHK
jgi:AcrR family transcriptional regulator